jgi:phospholipid/cholesterol/gamma-HCH transport system substrate-binding protein
MDERVLSFRVGVVVVAAVIITVILVMLFGAWPNVFQTQYEVHVKFPEAPGITVDTPVRKSGVLVGRVSKVTLLDEGGVLVSANIFGDYGLRQNETCRIGTGSILGDAILEFVPSGQTELVARFDADRNGLLDPEEERRAVEPIRNGDYISDGVVASNPLQVLVNLEGSISTAFASLENAGDEVSQLVRNMNETLGGDDPQVRRIMDKTERALDRFESTMQSIETVMGDEELATQLKQSLRDLPALFDESRQTLATARTTLATFQKVADKAEANLDSLAQFTGPLGEQGESLVTNVEASTRNMNELLAQLVAFSEALNSGQGTLGKLVHDDEVYQRIERLVENAEDLSIRLRPIVEDVRIFTDKIARDPRQLGVKGALDRRPSGLKTGVVW